MTDEVHFRLTRIQQEAIQRLLAAEWKPIGEPVNEVMFKLGRQLDTDWITEYLDWHDRVSHQEEN